MTRFTKVNFSAGDLKRIHPAHRGYLIASSHACNQINFSKIYHILENDNLVDRSPENAFIAIRQLNLLRFCISSIFEFNTLTSNYLGSIKEIFPTFAEKHKKSHAAIVRKISNERWVKILRNKFSFHFSATESLEMLENMPDDHGLYFIFGNSIGEVAYSFAEEIVSSNLAYGAGNGQIKAGSEKLWETMSNASSSIMNFHAILVSDILYQYNLNKDFEEIEAKNESYGSPGINFIPVFIRSKQ
ncbi:hypothetical protein ABE438_00475 [Bosea sp. TWI1241]|uniref:hypothetical protein n=1 Tax=Bosea sp. TWI1241 TaxID=3148904 RepID=UPI003209FC60